MPFGLGHLAEPSGPGLETVIQKFLELLAAMLPETPVLAVTQQDAVRPSPLRFLSEAGGDRSDGEARPSSRVIVRSSEDCFAADHDVGEVTEVEFRFHWREGKGRVLRALSSAGREPSIRWWLASFAIDGESRPKHEPALWTSGRARGSCRHRRRVSWTRSAGTVFSVIRSGSNLALTVRNERFFDAEHLVDAAFNEFENDTPIGSLLADIAASLARRSTRLFAFATDHELVLGRRRLCTDDEDANT